MSSLELQLPAGAISIAAGSRRQSRRSRSPSAHALSRSVSRVRVHASTPELSIAVQMVDDEHKEGEKKEQQLEGASNPATPVDGAGANGYVAEELEGASMAQLTKDTDGGRSVKATKLLAELDTYIMADDLLADRRLSKRMRKHYEAQNELVQGYKEIVMLDEAESAEEKADKASISESNDGAVKFAIEASLALTFVMITLKFFTAIWSGSIAVIASAVDSALDVISQVTLVITARFMNSRDPVKYPIGKSRVENLSVLVFSVIMGLAAVFLLYSSVLVLTNGLDNPPEIRIDIATIVILGFTIGVQFLMWIYCSIVIARGGRNVTAVEALAQDHINDVCCNSIGLMSAIVAAYTSVWFMDALGGILISIYIFARWSTVCHEQFLALLGQSADGPFLSKLTYLAMVHDPRILKVDTVIAYKLGQKYHCEVHVVLPAEMSLREAHDIGESLEQNIEKIPDVELAWVHLDFEWNHVGEHDRWNL